MRHAALFALALLASTAALAQAAPAHTPGHERRTVIVNLDEDVIEASPLGPRDVVVNTHVSPKFRSLIKVRTSFAPELLDSAAALAGGK